jgi:large subunit ribosomal protein L6
MSRIGRLPVRVPSGVDIIIDGNTVKVKGPKGELSQQIHPDISVSLTDGAIHVTRPSDSPEHRALHGLSRALIANMVHGVTAGFEKNLEITGVGYRATLQGKKLVLSVGYSHTVEIDPPEGISIEVPQPTKIAVKGIDKQLVGAVAAKIRSYREPEPYLGKGIAYQNERIRRKAGKAGKVSKG